MNKKAQLRSQSTMVGSQNILISEADESKQGKKVTFREDDASPLRLGLKKIKAGRKQSLVPNQLGINRSQDQERKQKLQQIKNMGKSVRVGRSQTSKFVSASPKMRTPVMRKKQSDKKSPSKYKRHSPRSKDPRNSLTYKIGRIIRSKMNTRASMEMNSEHKSHVREYCEVLDEIYTQRRNKINEDNIILNEIFKDKKYHIDLNNISANAMIHQTKKKMTSIQHLLMEDQEKEQLLKNISFAQQQYQTKVNTSKYGVKDQYCVDGGNGQMQFDPKNFKFRPVEEIQADEKKRIMESKGLFSANHEARLAKESKCWEETKSLYKQQLDEAWEKARKEIQQTKDEEFRKSPDFELLSNNPYNKHNRKKKELSPAQIRQNEMMQEMKIKFPHQSDENIKKMVGMATSPVKQPSRISNDSSLTNIKTSKSKPSSQFSKAGPAISEPPSSIKVVKPMSKIKTFVGNEKGGLQVPQTTSPKNRRKSLVHLPELGKGQKSKLNIPEMGKHRHSVAGRISVPMIEDQTSNAPDTVIETSEQTSSFETSTFNDQSSRNSQQENGYKELNRNTEMGSTQALKFKNFQLKPRVSMKKSVRKNKTLRSNRSPEIKSKVSQSPSMFENQDLHSPYNPSDIPQLQMLPNPKLPQTQQNSPVGLTSTSAMFIPSLGNLSRLTNQHSHRSSKFYQHKKNITRSIMGKNLIQQRLKDARRDLSARSDRSDRSFKSPTPRLSSQEIQVLLKKFPTKRRVRFQKLKRLEDVKSSLKMLLKQCDQAHKDEKVRAEHKYDCDIFLEKLKQENLQETEDLLKNLDFTESDNVKPLFNYLIDGMEEQKNVALDITQEYRSGMMDPSREAARAEREAVVKKSLLKAKFGR